MTCQHIRGYLFGRPAECQICITAQIEDIEEQIKRLQRDRIDLIQRLGERTD